MIHDKCFVNDIVTVYIALCIFTAVINVKCLTTFDALKRFHTSTDSTSYSIAISFFGIFISGHNVTTCKSLPGDGNR